MCGSVVALLKQPHDLYIQYSCVGVPSWNLPPDSRCKSAVGRPAACLQSRTSAAAGSEAHRRGSPARPVSLERSSPVVGDMSGN